MTLDEAIKHIEKIAEENQRIVDTGILFDNVTIDMLYCDDTEVIEEHLANYQKCAERHKQFAEWLKDYKRLLEQEPCEDAVSRQEVLAEIFKKPTWHSSDGSYYNADDIRDAVKNTLPVNPQKMGHWIPLGNYDDFGNENSYKCSECGDLDTYPDNFCPNCGVKMIEP